MDVDGRAGDHAAHEGDHARQPLRPAGRPALAAIAERHGLALVEDAAQAHGASIGDRRSGTWGAGTFSFYPTKNMTTGEGGMVSTATATSRSACACCASTG